MGKPKSAWGIFESIQASGIASFNTAASIAIETSNRPQKLPFQREQKSSKSSPTPTFLPFGDRERHSPQPQKISSDPSVVEKTKMASTMEQLLLLYKVVQSVELVVLDDDQPKPEPTLQPDKHKMIGRKVGREKGFFPPTKLEGFPKKPVKDKGNLNSFLDRLQNQAKKWLDDDERTVTPELMNLFNGIGGQNKNETIVETYGAVVSRDA
jgi:hypothetical protein